MKKKEFEFKLRLVSNKQDFEANKQLIRLIPKKNRWDYLECVTKGYGMQNAYQALPQIMELAKQLDITPAEVLEVYNQFRSLGDVLLAPTVNRMFPTNGSSLIKTSTQPLVSKSLIKN
jgi:hypothetical protein